MYDLIKNVIKEARFNLSELLVKIDTLWLQGEITDDEKTELVGLAQTGADYTKSLDILTKLEELDARLRALEKADETESEEEYSEYVAGKWYYSGDKVEFEGKSYVCIAPDGVVCTWSPTEYPPYWEEIEE